MWWLYKQQDLHLKALFTCATVHNTRILFVSQSFQNSVVSLQLVGAVLVRHSRTPCFRICCCASRLQLSETIPRNHQKEGKSLLFYLHISKTSSLASEFALLPSWITSRLSKQEPSHFPTLPRNFNQNLFIAEILTFSQRPQIPAHHCFPSAVIQTSELTHWPTSQHSPPIGPCWEVNWKLTITAAPPSTY